MIITSIAGFLLLALAAVSSSLSMNFQKIAQSQTNFKDPRHCKQKRKIPLTSTVCLRPLFLVAIILSISASILDFVALAFLPTSVVGIFATLSIVINLFVTRIVLFESPKKSEMIPIIFIFLGCTIALVSSANGEISEKTPPELLGRFTSAFFIVISWVVFISISIILDHYKYLPKWVQQVGWPVIAGGLGAALPVFGKYIAFAVTGVIENGSLPVRTDNLIAATALCIASIVVHVVWLNKGLKRFHAYYCILIYQSTWCLCTIINGIVVYDNNIMLPTDKWLFFITGVGAAIFGVVALAKTHAEKY
jgi:hypothetical protein